MLAALARLASSHPRRVIALALAGAVLAGAFGGGVAERLHPYGDDDPAAESFRASERLAVATGLDPGAGLVALVHTPQGPGAAASRAKVTRVARTIASDRAVGRVGSYYATGDRVFVSHGGRAQYAAASFRPTSDKEKQDAAERIDERLAGIPGVRLGGPAAAAHEVNKTVENDLRRAELLAFPLLFLLSLLFFRSGVAAALPLFVGGLAIVGTLAILRLANELTEISVFALNLTTGLGLGLAIDYSLFVVARYREELERTGPGFEAVRRTLATAGRTVVFSSLTVAAALASLTVFPQRFLYSMGIGGAAVALLAAAVALVVLPAVLALLGERVNGLSPRRLRRAAERDARPAAAGGWYRLSRFVMSRPGPIAAACTVALVLAGLPFLRIEFTQIDSRVLPTSSEPRQVDDTLARDFPRNRASATFLALDTRPNDAARAFADRVRQLPGAEAVTEPQPADRKTSVVQVVSKHRESSDESQQLVRDIRAWDASFEVLAGGRTAEFVDFKKSLVRPPAPRAGDRGRGHVRDPLPDDGLGGAAAQGARDERAHPQRHLRHPRPLVPGRAARGPARLHEPGRARDDDAGAAVRASRSASPPTTASSCCRGSRRRATAGLPTARRWRWASSGRAGSSPRRRSCSAWPSAPSPPPRSSSSSRTASARRWRC